MNRTDLFDKVLKKLYDKKDFVSIEEFVINICKVKDKLLIQSIIDELVDNDWAEYASNSKYHLKIRYYGQQIIDNHGSYSSFLEFENDTKKRKQRSKMTPTFISIGIAIIFGLSTALLGWLKYIDNKELKSKDLEIIKLNDTIEYLKSKVNHQ